MLRLSIADSKLARFVGLEDIFNGSAPERIRYTWRKMRSYSVSVISFTHCPQNASVRDIIQGNPSTKTQDRSTHHFDKKEDGATEAIVIQVLKGLGIVVPHFPDHVVADLVVPANRHVE